MKRIHQDGKDIIISYADKKQLKIDDFIERAMKSDYENSKVPVNFEIQDGFEEPVIKVPKINYEKIAYKRFHSFMGIVRTL